MKITIFELFCFFLQLFTFQIISTYSQNVETECKHINKTIAASKLIADFVVSRNVEQIVVNNLAYDDKGIFFILFSWTFIFNSDNRINHLIQLRVYGFLCSLIINFIFSI